MSDRIPRQVLSEHIQERMKGRRLVSAVFLTFRFEPGFFEQQVLPVILDVSASHVEKIRAVQLEDALREVKGDIAVYYDANGLVDGASGSAKLDIRRIPVRHHTGIFHPKNAFLLVEPEDAAEDGSRQRTLIVASLSANLTRAGWWENVESCHVEEIAEGDKSPLKDDLRRFLESLARRVDSGGPHTAVRDVIEFLRDLEQYQTRSAGGTLHPRFFDGTSSFVDFLDNAAGAEIRGAYLEIISPYFDDAEDSAPLYDLLARFEPKAVHIYLPHKATGEVACRRELYESVRELDGVRWGTLGGKWLALGSSSDAAPRFVHAKVYRFFTQSPKREITFVGSVNLTSSAFQKGGNLETGFLIDFVPPLRPDFWLVPEAKKATAFVVEHEGDSVAMSGGSALNLRYSWETGIAEGYWDKPSESPILSLSARDVDIGELPVLPSREWTPLGATLSGGVASLLPETSFFKVSGEGEEPSLILVQEEGMTHKPSLLLQLSAADILRYWSLLTANQRAAFIEEHASTLALGGDGSELVTAINYRQLNDTLFDRFAGVFHAFGCLERAVKDALADGREKEVDSRLFGKKYDSLGHLLDRVAAEKDTGDDVDRYVLVLCAHQLVNLLRTEYSEFCSARPDQTKELRHKVSEMESGLRQRIAASGGDMPAFLAWFDRWFLERAKPVEEPVS